MKKIIILLLVSLPLKGYTQSDLFIDFYQSFNSDSTFQRSHLNPIIEIYVEEIGEDGDDVMILNSIDNNQWRPKIYSEENFDILIGNNMVRIQ